MGKPVTYVWGPTGPETLNYGPQACLLVVVVVVDVGAFVVVAVVDAVVTAVVVAAAVQQSRPPLDPIPFMLKQLGLTYPYSYQVSYLDRAA